MVKNLKKYNVYIDESGDEGIKSGSVYFILTAVIVEKEKDLNVAKCVDDIKEKLQVPRDSQLHWVKVKGFPNKEMVINIIEEQELLIVNVIVDTKAIKHIISKNMYYHFSAYLFGKICDIMKHKNGKANLIISGRGQLRKDELVEYLVKHDKRKKISKDHLNLNPKHIKIYPNAKKRLLQLADCCCSSLGQAIKYNNETACKIYKPLIKKCHNYKNTYHKHGFIFVPYEAFPEKFMLIEDIKTVEGNNS